MTDVTLRKHPGRRVGLVAAGALLLVGIVATGWFLGGLRAPLRFEPGREYLYRVAWRGDEAVDLVAALGVQAGGGQAGSIRARYSLDGVLRLAALGDRNGATILGASFSEVTAASVEVGGQQALPSLEAARAQLTGVEAELLLGPDGVPRELRFPPAAAALFRRSLVAVLSDGRLDLRVGTRAWEVRETGQRGEAEVSWRASRGVTEDVAVKEKRRYLSLHALPRGLEGTTQALESRLEAVLSGDGELRRIGSRERLEVRNGAGTVLVASRSSLSLDLFRVGSLPAPVDQAAGRLFASVAGAPPARLDLPATAEREEEALARVAGGYDLSSMLEQLEALAPGQHLPRDFMWRGSAWLKLHPEDCARLAARFRELPADGRRGAVTLLVATGTPQAQGALRGLLEDARLREDDGRPMWLSTLSYLRDPEPATLRLLADESAAAGPGQGPATAALGAAIHAAKGESAPLATEFNARLRSELATTADPERRQVILTAMANAGRAENVADVSRHAADLQPQVRAAAANAVRQTQTAEAEGLLFGLASDPDRPVQAVALQTLAGYRMDAAMLERISGLVQSGAIGELGFPDLILLAARARQGGSPPEAIRALLAAMAGAPIRRFEIRELVERAQAQQG